MREEAAMAQITMARALNTALRDAMEADLAARRAVAGSGRAAGLIVAASSAPELSSTRRR